MTETRAELEALGHRPMSPLKALRLRCIDCCAGKVAEVELCAAKSCPSWDFRMGQNPWRKPVSDAQRQASRENARHLRKRRENHEAVRQAAGPGGAGGTGALPARENHEANCKAVDDGQA